MKNFLSIIILCSFTGLFAQEKVGFQEIYMDNDLTYKVADDQLFSGQGQRIRRNGHLVYEEYYEKGIPIKSISYYNRTEPPVPARMTEFYRNSFDKKKESNYGLDGNWHAFKYYDKNGKKILIEQYENKKLIYRCEYHKNKKHGTEFCIDDNGNENRISKR
ncbi:hypothetical protein [Sinomicrobium sp. M5D2P9]